MSSPSERLAAEIGHVLFLDIVGFSRRPMEEQARLTQELRAVVRGLPEYVRAMDHHDLLALDTGDGMALVFTRDPLGPAQCAVEIAHAIGGHPRLALRMGIHSGPVSRLTDINGRENVTGSAINTAQRVMDCGDGGHILLSSAAADVLVEFEAWAPCLCDLGECDVKHSQRLHLYNLVMEGVGNAMPPSRLKFAATPPPAAAPKPPQPSPPRVIGPAQKVVLLYKRGSADDERLLQLMDRALTEDGDQVFIDRHLKIGVAWAQEIERRIREADAVVVLLSEGSRRSEMLEYEVQTAHQAAQAQGGKPRLLPVRVAFEGALDEPLGALLDPLNYALWKTPEDDARIVAEIAQALHGPPPAAKEGKREPVGGAVPLDSRFYMVRPTDAEFLAAVAQQDSIVLVKGARQMGKTSLLARGLQQARDSGARVVLTDFQTLGAALGSLDALMLTLAESIAEQLDLDSDPRETWNPSRAPNANMERFLRREALGEVKQPLVWGLDEVDRLFPPACDFGSEVFGLFRSWHNRRALDPTGPWSRLTLGIAYATEAHLFITDLNQSPFNVGTRLTLADFTEAEVAALNTRYDHPLRGARDVAAFYALIGGQPYLTRRGLDEIGQRAFTIEQFAAEADRDEGLFGDHLRRLLVSVSQDAGLLEAVRCLLHGTARPSAESFYRLRSAGILKGNAPSEAQFRCRLYKTYLVRHLA